MTECEDTLWVSDTSVLCRAASGGQGSMRGSVTAGQRAGTFTGMLSTGRGWMSAMRRANAAASGSVSVSVHGGSFGVGSMTPSVLVSKTACERTVWEADTVVRCRTGHGGLGGSRGTAVTAGGVSSSQTSAFSGDGMAASGMLRGNAAATGSSRLTVAGLGLGLYSATHEARVGRTGSESTAWLSDTVVCIKLAGAAGGTRLVAATAATHAGSLTGGVSIQLPSLSSAKMSNMAATGSGSVTVSGAGLGLLAYTMSVSSGLSACERSSWMSDTSARCLRSGGVGLSRRAGLTVGVQARTRSAGSSFDVVQLSVTVRSNGPGTGSVVLSLHGSSMGRSLPSATVSSGGTASELTVWASDTSLLSMMCAGQSGSRRLVLSAGMAVGSVSGAVSTDGESLSVHAARNRGSTGSASVTVYGAGLGLVDYSGSASAGGSMCERTTWESGSTVRSHAGLGMAESLRTRFTVGAKAGSMTSSHSFDRSLVSGIARGNGVATGSASVTLRGADFGLASWSSRPRHGVTGCEATLWTSDS
jgi:hypothetical protein